MSFNSVVLTGRITKDLVVNSMQNANGVFNWSRFSIAVNYNSGGKEKTDYIDCMISGKIAENVAKYCGKGSLILVSGSLRQRVWEDENKVRREKLYVNVDRVEFLETQKPQGNTQAPQPQPTLYQPNVNDKFMQQPSEEPIANDDLPF